MAKLTKAEKKKRAQEKKQEVERKKREKQKQLEAKKKLNRKKRLQKRYKNLNIRERKNYLAPIAGYKFSPSYIQSGQRHATILKVVNKYGTNRNMQFGWFINIIPEITVDGVKAYLFESDKLMEPKEQDNIFKKEIHRTIKANDQSNDAEHETTGDRRLKELMVEDLDRASRGESQNESVVDAHIYVMLVSDDPDKLYTQLRKLNTTYKDNMNGIELVSVAGNQEHLFKRMLDSPEGTKYEYTWMSADFAGNDHAVRKGLDDAKGIAVGEITESYSSGTALMSISESIKKRALVASYPSSSVIDFEEYDDLTGSSLWGQRIANDAMTHDHRVFHIVMNGFHYEADEETYEGQEERKFACPPIMNSELEHIDLAKGGLNPLEMFGDLDDVVDIYNTNLSKIVQMFHLMSERALTTSQRTMLRKALNQFYMSRDMWKDDAEENPRNTRIVNLRHETVPLMGQFVQDLTNMLSRANMMDSAKEQEDAKLLKDVLEISLQSYRAIFNRHTSLPDPRDVQKMQIYYDLSRLMNQPDMLEAQFLNAFDYISQATKPGDIIMIHGMNRLSLETLDILSGRIENASRKGARLVYLFDNIGSGSTKSKIERADVFNTDGLLYQNFDNDFDYTILGAMSINDLELYQKKVKQKLTQNLKETLTASGQVSKTQYQIRRVADATSVMVLANFIV